jgi:hypothetical protein
LRIREGRYAYDLEQPVDPRTQLRSKWKYTIFQVSPFEKILHVGEADTREAAETEARRWIARAPSHDTAA